MFSTQSFVHIAINHKSYMISGYYMVLYRPAAPCLAVSCLVLPYHCPTPPCLPFLSPALPSPALRCTAFLPSCRLWVWYCVCVLGITRHPSVHTLFHLSCLKHPAMHAVHTLSPHPVLLVSNIELGFATPLYDVFLEHAHHTCNTVMHTTLATICRTHP